MKLVIKLAVACAAIGVSAPGCQRKEAPIKHEPKPDEAKDAKSKDDEDAKAKAAKSQVEVKKAE